MKQLKKEKILTPIITNLPKLPRVLKQKEASFGVYLTHWIEKNPMFSCSLETKHTYTDSIPFSAVEPEQLAWGLAISSDKGAMIRVTGLNGQPDYIWCRNMPAFVVIKYPKSFHFISVETFIMEKKKSVRKSLTSKRAFDISVKSVKI